MKSVTKSPQDNQPALIDLPLNASMEEPFLRPRHRMRLGPVRRTRVGRVALVLRVLAALILVSAASSLVLVKVQGGERFRVKRLVVRGNRHLSDAEIGELLATAKGVNILQLRLEQLEQRLRESPWVDWARVRRTLPDTLEVDITERQPLALAEVDSLYLMDSEGVLIDLYGPRVSGYDLPIIRGLAGLEPALRREKALRAGALLHDLGELNREVSEITVENTGDLRVVLMRTGDVLLFGAPPYRARLAAFLAMRARLTERCPLAEYYDLRFKGRIVVPETREVTEQGTLHASAPAGARNVEELRPGGG